MKLPSKNVKNHEKLRFHNSVRPDPAAPGPRKLRVVFPVISVLSKPPQLPYGAKYSFWGGGVGLGGELMHKSSWFAMSTISRILVHLWEKTNHLTFQDRLLRFSEDFLLLQIVFEKYVGEVSRNK